MSSETILKSHVLDIIFLNRNKEYGAYTLRKYYPQRLYLALLFTFGIVSIFTAFSFIEFPNATSTTWDSIGDTVKLVIIAPPPIMEPPRPPKQSSVAVIKSDIPIIVRDAVTEVPENKDIEDKVVGLITKSGVPTDDGPAPAAPASGTGEVKTEVEKLPEAKEEILTTADVMPEFPGGFEAMKRFLSRNLRNPEEDMATGTNVRLVARFVVDKDGSISQILFKEPGGSKFELEVIRVLKKMPKWKPGIFRGRPAAVYFRLPVVFQMNEE